MVLTQLVCRGGWVCVRARSWEERSEPAQSARHTSHLPWPWHSWPRWWVRSMILACTWTTTQQYSKLIIQDALSVCQVLTCHPCTFYIFVIWITWRQFFWQSQYLDHWSYKDYIRSYRDYINQNAQSKKPIHTYMKKGKIIITSKILKLQTYSLY